MPQSTPARPPEPSSPPASEPNAPPDHLQAADEPPASDSEAETERLHDSPVKKRTALELDFVSGSVEKRLRAAAHSPAPLAAPSPGALDAAAARAPRSTNGSAVPPAAEPQPAKPASAAALAEPAGPVEPPQAASPPLPDADTADTAAAAAPAEQAEDANAAADIEDDEAAEAGDAEDDEDDADDGEDGDMDDEDENENENDEENETETENDEERIRAVGALAEIEVEFAKFCDRLHDQQIARFDLEIQMCTSGVHPELEQYHLQIRDERDKRLQRSRSLLAYQMSAILNHSHAGRCQVHQTHLKSQHALRGDFLTRITRQWYQVNYERLNADRVLPDYGYVAQARPHQIRRPTARGMGIQYHPGLPLPAAPPMICATEDECDEDLRQLGLR